MTRTVSHGGLVPVVALEARARGCRLLGQRVRPGGGCGVNAPLKVGCLVAGMAAGAGSIDDMGLLRHGAMGVLVRRDPLVILTLPARFLLPAAAAGRRRCRQLRARL